MSILLSPKRFPFSFVRHTLTMPISMDIRTKINTSTSTSISTHMCISRVTFTNITNMAFTATLTCISP